MKHERNLVRGKLFFKLVLISIFGLGSSGLVAGPLEDLKPGEWYEVPNSRLYDERPDGWSANVVLPWSGGAYDTKRDRLVIWGGGHLDYAGNEVYVFDINALQWERLTDPSTDIDSAGTLESTGLYPDGLPRARHTYDYIEYLPNIDKFVSFGGYVVYPSSATSKKLHAFDFDTLTWDSTLAELPSGGSAGTVSYNPADGTVWANNLDQGGRGQVDRYDPITDTWTRFAKQDMEIYAVSAIDPKRNIMVTIGGYSGAQQMFKWDLSNPNAPPVNLLSVTTGPTDLLNDNAPGFVFDPVSDKFVAWGGATNSWGPSADVFTLDPDTWAWTQVTAAPTNTVIPSKPAGVSGASGYPTGTYGRFQYMPSKNAFILYNSIYENVFIYKLSADPLLGDFDTDGDVDGADFLEWQRKFGSTLDADSLTDWESNFGTVAALVSAEAVPEPHTVTLVFMAGLALFGARRMRT